MTLKQIQEKEFYVCPNHCRTGGFESCCNCGGWEDGEEVRDCTESESATNTQEFLTPSSNNAG